MMVKLAILLTVVGLLSFQSCAPIRTMNDPIADEVDVVSVDLGSIAVPDDSLEVDLTIDEDLEPINPYADINIPAGVDTLVAVRVDSLAKQLFATYSQERKARTVLDSSLNELKPFEEIIRLFRLRQDQVKSMTLEDSLQWSDHINAAIDEQERAEWQIKRKFGKRIYTELSSDEVSRLEERIRSRVTLHYEKARDNLIEALKLDPFFIDLRNELVQVQSTLAVLKRDADNIIEANNLLESLHLYRPSEFYYLYQMAQNYQQMGQLNRALILFRQAEDLIWENVVFQDDNDLDIGTGPATIVLSDDDQDWIIELINSQFQLEYKLGYASSAITTLNRLIGITSVENRGVWIDWKNAIMWDNGNLWTLRQNDVMDSLISVQDYGEALKTAESFLSVLTNRTALSQVQFKSAIIKYQYLDRREEGIDDLQRLVGQDSSIPDDSTENKYFESYGVMCVNEGDYYLDKERTTAMKYYTQATTFSWTGQYRCYLYMAELSQNRPDMVLEYCNIALSNDTNITIEDQLDAHQMMYHAYKRLRQSDQARACAERYRLLRSQANADNN